jgi:hypothetical protein
MRLYEINLNANPSAALDDIGIAKTLKVGLTSSMALTGGNIPKRSKV